MRWLLREFFDFLYRKNRYLDMDDSKTPIALLQMKTIVGLYAIIRNQRTILGFRKWIFNCFPFHLSGYMVFSEVKRYGELIRVFSAGELSEESLYKENEKFHDNFIDIYFDRMSRRYNWLTQLFMYLMVLAARWTFLFRYLWKASFFSRTLYYTTKILGFILVSIPIAFSFILFREIHNPRTLLFLIAGIPLLSIVSIGLFNLRAKTMAVLYQRILNNDHHNGVFS